MATTQNRKLVVLLGSPRQKGNSAALAEQVVTGATAGGADVESFYLHGMEIQPCDACEACRGHSDDGCIVEDGMQEIYPKLRDADAFVIASPIYWFNMSAQAKLFMDRCYAFGGPQGHGLTGKQVGIVVTFADADLFVSGAVNALRSFQDSYRYIGTEVVGMVSGCAEEPGDIRGNQAVMDQARQLGEKLAAG